MSEVVYAVDRLPAPPVKVVFLAGPVPRETDRGSWHDEAIRRLRESGFVGVVVVPRVRPGERVDDDGQMRWEHSAMCRADALLFWVPKVLWSAPGLTTNLEWGVWHASGKAVLGAPPDAPRMRYLRYFAEIGGAPTAGSLAEAARIATELVDRGG